MSPNRRSRRDLTSSPQRGGAASEPITQRTAVYPVPVAAPRPFASVAAAGDAAARQKETSSETIGGIGSVPMIGVRSGTFALRETLPFGAPASGSPLASQPTVPVPAKLVSAASVAATRRILRPRQAPVRQDPAPIAEPSSASPEAKPSAKAREKAAPGARPRPTPGAGESAAPGAARAQAARVQPESTPGQLFRSAALDARRLDGLCPELGAGVKARRWGLLSLILSLIVLSSVGAALASVEVTAEAEGVLRAPKGLRPVASVLAGAVTEVLVSSGDTVEEGQVIVRLEATELRATLEARERELALVREDVARSQRHDELLEGDTARALQRRRAALRERIDVNAERREQRRTHDQNVAALVGEGGASRAEGLAAKEALQEATELVSSLSNELALLDLEIADRARQGQERQSTRRTQLGRAEAGVEEARTLLAASEIRAPAAGRVESLVAAPGAVISAGGLLGNIVPNGAPRLITGFVPSREIAFVQPGAAANVEVQSLSVGEFGLAKARVTRVSADVATPAEVQSVLGEAASGPHVRVELELLDSETSAAMEPLLRSGERVKIRLHRRERRLITLLFDFVRRWLS